ncbi:hypothetical protein C7974DRAFT_48329 [Boeremia exigua]|uniref:uncharacterized protein n=1 Tax=Boeremia exigua TaxID=749465 RepID=UPI001E8DBC0F|nr:uncharacterized protein C7974DRAFT_48329 [Boeremia exigua]KAH6616618.1 hypothetical protein C7974DRAFT_48329 [Boeremia exigua]
MRNQFGCVVIFRFPSDLPTLTIVRRVNYAAFPAVVSFRSQGPVEPRRTLATPEVVCNNVGIVRFANLTQSLLHSRRAKQNQGERKRVHAHSYMRGWAFVFAGWRPRIIGLASDLSARFPSLPMRTRVHELVYTENRGSVQGFHELESRTFCCVALAVPHYAAWIKVKLRGQLAVLLYTETDRHLHSFRICQAHTIPYPPRIARPPGVIRGSSLGSIQNSIRP